MDVNDTRRARSRVSGFLALGLALGLAAGCGGDDDDDAAAFIGTWQIIEGNAVACGLAAPLGGAQVKMTAGTESPLQVDVRGCLMRFDINGSTATARANQTCKTTFEFMNQNLEVDLAVASANFTITGSTGNLTMTGTAMTTFLPGGGCPYQTMASATKVMP